MDNVQREKEDKIRKLFDDLYNKLAGEETAKAKVCLAVEAKKLTSWFKKMRLIPTALKFIFGKHYRGDIPVGLRGDWKVSSDGTVAILGGETYIMVGNIPFKAFDVIPKKFDNYVMGILVSGRTLINPGLRNNVLSVFNRPDGEGVRKAVEGIVKFFENKTIVPVGGEVFIGLVKNKIIDERVGDRFLEEYMALVEQVLREIDVLREGDKQKEVLQKQVNRENVKRKQQEEFADAAVRSAVEKEKKQNPEVNEQDLTSLIKSYLEQGKADIVPGEGGKWVVRLQE